jgi:mannose-6-phosphate isomerase-like protein (cupin superfamily)
MSFREASAMFMRVCILLALAFLSRSAGAQRPDSARIKRATFTPMGGARAEAREAEKRRRRLDYIDGQTLERVSASLSKRSALGQTIHTSADDQTTYLLVRRTTSSKPEVHARWDDLVLVRAGTGAIEMGDSLVGSTYRAPGELAGGRFTKSYRLVVRPGDLVRIPAAVPHAFIVSGTAPLEYLVIKQRRQELPIRWHGEP